MNFGSSPLRSAYELSAGSGIKTTVYGRAGMGKTVLLTTAPSPVILSAEQGLLSVRKVIEEQRIALNNPRFDIPVYPIKNLPELKQAYSWMSSSKEARNFQTFGLDSVSEIAEQVVNAAKAKSNDPRRAYGEMIDETLAIFRQFRDFAGPNVVFLAKEEAAKHGITGAMRFMPMFPGQALSPQTPYLFDEVFRMVSVKDAEGKDQRALMTQPDHESEAKDRSGRLAPLEWPNLSYIFAKILGKQ